ncbi:MAG: AzlC family ABC transporter permease [Oscillospiraceae bacterium]|nr:AzlC family ABC transporter permease [Oscillospiraceae bacterium]
MNAEGWKRAFLKTLPVMAGYLVMGAGFGILFRVNGYGPVWALCMSVFLYAGSMQFVGISLLASGASAITVAVTTLLVQARHLFYGLSLVDRYKGAGFKKLYMIHAITDETYSLVCSTEAPEDVKPHAFYFAMSLLDHIYWIAGCVLGNLIGGFLTFDTTGLDFAMTALFVTIFVEQWQSTKEHRPALLGAILALVCLVLFGAENFLIPAMVAITLGLTALWKPLEKGVRSDG